MGTRVRIALHGRRVGGWVVAVDVEPPEGVALQPLRGVSGFGPPAPVIELCEWAAWRWAGPLAVLLRTASPGRVVRTLPVAPLAAGTVPVPVPPADAELGRGALAVRGRPALVRLPPAHDLLGLVLSATTHQSPGASVLVMVPSRGWPERLVARLDRRGVPATAEWAAAAAGWPVVVGSRSAAFSPVPRLAAALVLDAHDEAYREERSPHFDAWEVVAERAARDGAPCVLTSPCPTAAQVARCEVLAPPRSVERSGWPAIAVVDRRGADPRTGLLSHELVRLAERAERLVCVLNRRGRARLLACAGCGELVRCEHCGRALGQVDGELACPGCGARRPMVCARCGATRLRILRPGVTRVREELEALVGRPVGEVGGGPEGDLPPMLVGTEAVLHRIRRADAVAFLDFDQHLLAPRIAAAEESLALLARAGRLVGPRGPVLVQTRLPDHEVLVSAVRGDPARLTASELALREEAGLPPARAVATTADPAAAELAGVEVHDLGDGRWLLSAPDSATLADALARAPRPLRVTVDPRDL